MSVLKSATSIIHAGINWLIENATISVLSSSNYKAIALSSIFSKNFRLDYSN